MLLRGELGAGPETSTISGLDGGMKETGARERPHRSDPTQEMSKQQAVVMETALIIYTCARSGNAVFAYAR